MLRAVHAARPLPVITRKIPITGNQAVSSHAASWYHRQQWGTRCCHRDHGYDEHHLDRSMKPSWASSARSLSTSARFHAATSAKPLPDPHNVSNQLDSETIEAIVQRLEERGRDPTFRSLFNYFDLIQPDARVLEVGCGTGVMSRTLSKHPSFHGEIVGVDQCTPFLEVAKELAVEEACDMGKLEFIEGDAHDLTYSLTRAGIQDKFDVIVMHTLLSHATHPNTVLRSASEVASDAANLIVMDGDYASLTYGHSEQWIGRQMDQALVDATFKKPDIIRQLVANMDQCGWQISRTKATCVAEIGSSASYWVSFAECYAPRVKASGILDTDIVDQWLLDQAENLNQGKFFASCNYYTLVAEKLS